MGNAQKALVMAAGIFLAIALITIAVVMFVSAQEATKTAQENFSNIQNELSSTSFTVYDNTTISGSQVVNALRKFDNRQQFGIRVYTGRNKATGGTWYNHVVDNSGNVTAGAVTALDNASNQALDTYINPSGRFTATIIRDGNNVVHALQFVQN
ncbi:ABC transporter permease [Tumebacillus permanentifrigoris]|uniref:ABC transporter permease n=1 Tax=Tumebacillus permanentifrigoris TaxID=378543 RepID=A0A316DPJ3_9BACL|nr:ABC transporter permease [Tumebacillus permanentifrigoris]PWK05006.1 hypothetical protein C7459_1294 [Tumebacillus permanentifrigoris]